MSNASIGIQVKISPKILATLRPLYKGVDTKSGLVRAILEDYYKVMTQAGDLEIIDNYAEALDILADLKVAQTRGASALAKALLKEQEQEEARTKAQSAVDQALSLLEEKTDGTTHE